ncbi:MAG: MFS transporter [Beijerinckiaceae bacterium]
MTDTAKARTTGAFLLVAVLAGAYTISQFSRNAMGVVAPDLARELSLTAADVGLLSSVFFLAFAAAQIPLGIALDRIGPKKVMIWSTVFILLGTVIFSYGHSLWVLVAGRLVLGLGCSTFLMAPLLIYNKAFPPERFASLTGLHLAIGNLGTLAATTPLAVVTAAMGWRNAFLLVGVVAIVSALSMIVVLAADDISADAKKTGLLGGLTEPTRVKSFWPMALLVGITYPGFATVAGLWGGPWLADVYGMDLQARGNTLLWLVLGHIVGLFVWGPVERAVKSYKKPLLAGGAMSLAALLYAALFHIPQGWLPVWFAIFGFGLAYAPLMMAHARMLFPPHLTGRGLTLLNLCNMSNAFSMQFLTGLLVNQFPRAASGAYPASAYAAVMAVLAAFLALALGAYLTVPDRHPARAV